MPIHQKKYIQAKFDKTYELRSFIPSDAEALQSFFHQSALESTHTLHYKEKPISISKLEVRIKTAAESPSELFLGVFDKGKIIGQVYCRVQQPDHPWVKHIGEFGMTVLKDYWGQGIGTELLQHMETFASTIGISRIEAKVRTTNEQAISLYRKFGYQIEGTRKMAALINGSFEDELYIAKLIS
ncbi:MAG: GNAT family N-acetyltransferase [Silvanigrellaceae bacterium]|nr:GNAT family N-acetyltransferase [Silvanigrellaceae bacterium]